MKLIMASLLITLNLMSPAFAEESALPDFTVNKGEVEKSLKYLYEQGQISESDYKKAVLQLGGMNDEQLSDLKNKALGIVKEDPKKAEKMINQKPAPTTTPSSAPAKK
jgi:hypothetical protein